MTMIMVTSPKGGVGVTAVVAELASALAAGGRNVVAVGLTDQAALGYRIGRPDDADDGYGDTVARNGPSVAVVDPAVARGSGRAGFALAQRREGAVVVVDVAAGDRATCDALLPHVDLTLCVLVADAGSLAVLPQAVRYGGEMPYCVLNSVDERRVLAADAVTAISAVFGTRLLGTVRQDEAMNEALAALAPLAASSGAAADFTALAGRIEEVLMSMPSALIGDVA